MVREKPYSIIPAEIEREALVGHKAVTGIELMGREWFYVIRDVPSTIVYMLCDLT